MKLLMAVREHGAELGRGERDVTGMLHPVLFEELEKIYGGKWDLEADPVVMARKMIDHIDKKRKALGIDRARERGYVAGPMTPGVSSRGTIRVPWLAPAE